MSTALEARFPVPSPWRAAVRTPAPPEKRKKTA